VRLRTTLRVSVKLESVVPIAIASSPSGPSVVSAASAWCVKTSTRAAVREERKPCRVVLPRVVSRWYFRESFTATTIFVGRKLDEVGEVGGLDHPVVEALPVEEHAN
jgi:hypothetical protein